MPLIKNPKGVIVAVTEQRKEYLLLDNPPVRNADGSKKINNNGKVATHLKADHEKGWTAVTPEEEKAYYAQLEEDQEKADKVTQAQEAAGLVAVAGALAAKNATDLDQKNATSKGKAGRPAKSAAQKKADEEAKAKEEMEAKVRDAEGDKAKYDALSDEEKEMYAALGLSETVA